jgi:hypothetical protein
MCTAGWLHRSLVNVCALTMRECQIFTSLIFSISMLIGFYSCLLMKLQMFYLCSILG